MGTHNFRIDLCIGTLHIFVKGENVIRQELPHAVIPLCLGVVVVDKLYTGINSTSGPDNFVKRVQLPRYWYVLSVAYCIVMQMPALILIFVCMKCSDWAPFAIGFGFELDEA